jgi:hypothetical protein
MTHTPDELCQADNDWFMANRDYLMLYVEYFKYLLKTSYPEFAEERSIQTQQNFERRIVQHRERFPGVAPIDYLAELFGLTEFEKCILLLGIVSELDSSFVNPMGKDHPLTINLSLALAILPNADWSSLTPEGSLRHNGLINVDTSSSLTAAKFSVPESVLHYIIGVASEDASLMSLSGTGHKDSLLDENNTKVVQAIYNIWTEQEGHSSLLFSLTGENIDIKREVALSLANKFNMRLKVLPVFFIPSDLKELQKFVISWDREILLNEYLLFIECDNEKDGDADRQKMIDIFIDKLKWPVLCSSEDKRQFCRKEQFAFEVNKPSIKEQRLCWQSFINQENICEELNEVSSHFDLSFREIQTFAMVYKSLGSEETLWSVCRKFSKVKMGSLAQKIDPAKGALDLILPQREKIILDEIIAQVKLRSTVYEDWGLLQNSSRGQGVTALFTGASGTGKTTAAEYLSLRLNLDLYRIDLSSIVSKYIGETEKNLQKIFQSAEKSGAILLFDEADALFGKRTQVKDSNDKHANTEVSYLLQRMESFRGLAILTSNFRDSFDKAFIRRLRFIVQFPFPSPEERKSIWQAMCPKNAPLNGIDFEKLAQLNVAGGNIRNITMNACFLAASAGEALQMKHYLNASRNEYEKLEKNITAQEVKGWV